MSKLSENLPPDIDALFDKPGHEWSREERHRVRRWLAEDPQVAKRLQDIAQKHLRRPQSLQAPDMAAEVVQDYLTRAFDTLCDHYDPCPAELLRKHVRDFGRLLDTLCRPPEALAAFLRERLSEGTRQVLDQQWPLLLRDAVTADLNRMLDDPSLYTAKRFARVQLQEETRQLLAQGGAPPEARRLNLLLLRDAYRHIFLRSTGQLRVRDFGRLLDKLCRPPEALAAFLRERLSEGTRQVLDQQWPLLRDAVTADLNRMLDDPSLYTAERFATVQLQAKTRRFLSQHQPEADPRRLNRMLLTDAYQECLIPARAFLAYLFLCLQRYCYSVKRPPELPATMVETHGAEGNIEMTHTEHAETLTQFITWFGDTLAAIPPKDRRLILMHYFFHLSLARCAEAFDISEVNARVRLHRARQKLVRVLRQQAYFQELRTDADFWSRFYAYGYWEPFSDALVRRFAAELHVPQHDAEDAASEDGQDDGGGL